MHSIKLRSHVGSDGILQLQVPVGLRDTDLEIMVIVHPVISSAQTVLSTQEGWPVDFFEKTFGSIPDLERPPQGELQEREPLQECGYN